MNALAPASQKETRSVRQHLARHTRKQHLALHTHPDLLCLTQPDISSAAYGGIVAAYSTFYASAEQTRIRHQVAADLGLYAAVTALAHDRIALKGVPDEGNTAPFSFIENPPQTLGMLYVLIGAQFGGSVIAKSIRAHHPALPVAYFSAASNAEQWRRLLARLESSSEQEREDILAGAERTFRMFGAHVSETCAQHRAA